MNPSDGKVVPEEAIRKWKQQVEIQLQYTNSLTKMYRKAYPQSAWHFPKDHDLVLPPGWNLKGEELRKFVNNAREE